MIHHQAQEAMDEVRRLARERWGHALPEAQLEETMRGLRPILLRVLGDMEREGRLPPEVLEDGLLTGAILREVLEPDSEPEGGVSDDG